MPRAAPPRPKILPALMARYWLELQRAMQIGCAHRFGTWMARPLGLLDHREPGRKGADGGRHQIWNPRWITAGAKAISKQAGLEEGMPGDSTGLVQQMVALKLRARCALRSKLPLGLGGVGLIFQSLDSQYSQ